MQKLFLFLLAFIFLSFNACAKKININDSKRFTGRYAIKAIEPKIGEKDLDKTVLVNLIISIDNTNNALISISSKSASNIYCEGKYKGVFQQSGILKLTYAGEGICGEEVNSLYVRKAGETYFIKGERFTESAKWLTLTKQAP